MPGSEVPEAEAPARQDYTAQDAKEERITG